MQISLRGLTKRFGAVTAVDGLTLEVRPGELVSLVGGSGCGKTTTLRLVAGFERPDAGQVLFDGRVVNDVPPRRRNVGIVFQSYALFPTMTVAENVAFGLRVARWPEARVRARVAEMLALTHLSGLEGRYPNQLSGGQQQRVAIARSLINDPHVILADEPTGNLDSKTSDEIMELLLALNECGKTIIMVTHENDIAAWARRVVRMRDGLIESDTRTAPIARRNGAAPH